MTLGHCTLAAALLCAAPAALAGCDLILQIDEPRSEAHAVAWEGCGGAGHGVQTALDFIDDQGGGRLQLRGPGSLLVGAPLFVGSNTELSGDPARGPYGTTLLAKASEGFDYRVWYRPMVVVYDARNVTLQHLDFRADGRPEDHNLHAPAVGVLDSSLVLLSTLRASSVQIGFAIKSSEQVTLRQIELDMLRSRHGRPEGGAGVWFRDTRDSVLEYSRVQGDEYYEAGPPNNSDYRPLWPNAAPAMDLVAVHGGQGNVIRHNTITRGNTAGIYANCFDGVLVCQPGHLQEELIIAGNRISHFRQHGLDLAHTLRPLVRDNVVSHAEMALVALGNVHQGVILDNTLRYGGLERGGLDFGALYLLWGSSENLATGNEVEHAGNYAVYLKPAGQGYPDPQGNFINGNRLGDGLGKSYVGGVMKGNKISH